ncbi:MAG: sulfotransferase [bacterium]
MKFSNNFNDKNLIVILAVFGRSGSTLLQRIFNIRKETMIWGEHRGEIRTIYNIQQSLINTLNNVGRKQNEKYFNDKNEPYNNLIQDIIPEEKYIKKAIKGSIKSFIENLYSKDLNRYDTIGFKELRYNINHINILKEIYPDINLIFLVRNPIDIYKSVLGYFPHDIDFFIEQWNNHVESFIELEKLGYPFIKYEDIINKDKKTLDIICNMAKIDKNMLFKVLNKKIGSTSQDISNEQKIYIINNCFKNMKKLNYKIKL